MHLGRDALLEVAIIVKRGQLIAFSGETGAGLPHLHFELRKGEDKPVKYPLMFRECAATLLNKIDLLPHLDYDLEAALKYIHQVHPDMPVFQISARTEQGFEPWIEWLRNLIDKKTGR